MSEIKTPLSFCRKCLREVKTEARVCHACDSARIAAHSELNTLSIAHLDCDAFYAAIEKRDDPSLNDRPVIIGGGKRGVVSTACYIARTYGVKSAMPMFKALKACPDAVVIRPNIEKYVTVGRQVRDMMNALTPLVEPLSIDEAFMDLTGTERLHHMSPAQSLADLQNRIAKEIGVTVSIGLSHNKFLAKIASDYDKPNGFFVIGKEETFNFLAPQPISLIWGVGKAMEKKLRDDGFTHIKHLQQAEQSYLAKRYGELGLRLYSLARGKDSRHVRAREKAKSVSSETTFEQDVSDVKWLEDRLWLLCEKLSMRMKEKNLVGKVVTLKLKTSTFKNLTRRKTLEKRTNLARVLFQAASPMLNEMAKGGAYRLIGVGFSDIEPPQQAPQTQLFPDEDQKLTDQENAIDAIRRKFGDNAIGSARVLKKTSANRPVRRLPER